MPTFQWSEELEQYIADHDVSRDEYKEAFDHVLMRESSGSTGRPTIVAWVRGCCLRVVFEVLSNGDILPVTAFEIEDWRL